METSVAVESPVKFRQIPAERLERIRGQVILEETRGEFHAEVRQREGISVTEMQAAQLLEAAFEALRLASLISDSCTKQIGLRCSPRIYGYMTDSFMCSQHMIEDEMSSQAAAVLHEFMHDIQENMKDLPWEMVKKFPNWLSFFLRDIVEFKFSKGFMMIFIIIPMKIITRKHGKLSCWFYCPRRAPKIRRLYSGNCLNCENCRKRKKLNL